MSRLLPRCWDARANARCAILRHASSSPEQTRRGKPSSGSIPFARLPVALLAGALAGALPAGAQQYPSPPIKIIVSTPPAASPTSWRGPWRRTRRGPQDRVVENRTGAGGTIAADFVAKSPPDGYTSMSASTARSRSCRTCRSFRTTRPRTSARSSWWRASPNVLVVHPSVPVQSMQQLVAHAKANPGKLTYASQGNGSSGHIVGEQFKQVTGTDIVHVPYRGAAPAVQDLVAGHVTMMFDILALASAQVTAGKVRALAVAAPQRVPALPDVPTMAEAGLPQLEGGPWFGLLVPAGTPRAIDRLAQRRGQEGVRGTGGTRTHGRAEPDAGARHAGGFRRPHRGGNQALGRRDPHRRHQDGVIRAPALVGSAGAAIVASCARRRPRLAWSCAGADPVGTIGRHRGPGARAARDAAALRREIERRAAALARSGLGRGAVVAIAHGGTARFFADLIATWSVGATAACLDPALTDFERDTVLGFLKPAVLLVDDAALSTATPVRQLSLAEFLPQTTPARPRRRAPTIRRWCCSPRAPPGRRKAWC